MPAQTHTDTDKQIIVESLVYKAVFIHLYKKNSGDTFYLICLAFNISLRKVMPVQHLLFFVVSVCDFKIQMILQKVCLMIPFSLGVVRIKLWFFNFSGYFCFINVIRKYHIWFPKATLQCKVDKFCRLGEEKPPVQKQTHVFYVLLFNENK